MLKKVILFTVVAIASITIFIYHAELFSLLQSLEKEKTEMPFFVAFILILLKTTAAPLLIPGSPLTLLAGSLFGKFFGFIISVIGNNLGAALAFLLSRYVFYDYVQKNLLNKYPKIKSYSDRLETKGLSTVIVLRLIPLFPFNVLNFLLGVTNIPFRAYLVGTFFGMIPGTFLFVYFGESLRMFSVANILLAILGLGVLIYLGKLYERRF